MESICGESDLRSAAPVQASQPSAEIQNSLFRIVLFHPHLTYVQACHPSAEIQKSLVRIVLFPPHLTQSA